MTAVDSSSQDKILYQIKRLGPQPAKVLGSQLGLTTMAIRQHLANLESVGLIEANEPEVVGRGRPVSTWQLTDAGHARFPDAHAQVTAELIASVRDTFGDEGVDAIVAKRAEQAYAHYESALSGKATLAGKINALAKVRSAEGYMAEVEKISSSVYHLIEQHCPICIAATSCQGFCQQELTTFQKLLDGLATVERDEYLLDGGRRCTYLITANES